MAKKVLILGVNGFIGSHLLTAIMNRTDWEVYGLDLTSHKIEAHLNNPRFHFKHADLRSESEWVKHMIQVCDTVLPLVAIANPQVYVDDPLRVYELDFEANMPIIRWCAAFKKHLVFPSTSEVYGMSPDKAFDEYSSNLVLGPVTTPRWIYSCSKQLLDRVILALNQRESFPFTLFRPFNWFGPGLDELGAHVTHRTRVVTQFMNRILRGEDLVLSDGGSQMRSFTYIDDGIDALFNIIENKDNCAHQEIFNIGNPNNQASVATLAESILAIARTLPAIKPMADTVNIVSEPSAVVYGAGYQDVPCRVPSIENARRKLGFEPKVSLQEGLERTWAAAL
ncbi:MAG: bifunctional UDP-4-keto-pentose/UDP-xylose synthase [Gammaproteobacteria bacterium]